MSVPDHNAPKSYREAGVDVDHADRFVDYIKSIRSPSIGNQLGAFGAAVELPIAGYRRPLLVSTTDGVGTKILVAAGLRDFSTIGIDLVAMNVNDLAVCGVKPLSFLDYIACGSIRDGVLREIVDGIVRGCEIAGCSLAGGETAEMPDLYGPEDVDLAGFCTGVVEAESLLPKKDSITSSCVLYGIASSGVHSNGLSLARKVIPHSDVRLRRELLTPTKIYVSELLQLIESGGVLGAAHVTGGGLVANLSRVIPDGLVPRITWNWSVPEIFDAIQDHGQISIEEMRRVFNMGVGVVLVCDRDRTGEIESIASRFDIPLLPIGTLTDG